RLLHGMSRRRLKSAGRIQVERRWTGVLAEERARVLVQDPPREPPGGVGVEPAGVDLLLEHLRDQAAREAERSVALLHVPRVAAEHEPRLVREHLDRLVQGQLEVRRAEEERPRKT